MWHKHYLACAMSQTILRGKKKATAQFKPYHDYVDGNWTKLAQNILYINTSHQSFWGKG